MLLDLTISDQNRSAISLRSEFRARSGTTESFLVGDLISSLHWNYPSGVARLRAMPVRHPLNIDNNMKDNNMGETPMPLQPHGLDVRAASG